MRKIFTSVPQSKKLIELGVPPETADLWYAERYAGYIDSIGRYIVDDKPVYYPSLTKPSENNYSQDVIKDIPAWSLSALLNLLGEYELDGYGDYTEVTCAFTPNMSSIDPIDAVFEMVCYRKENNL